MQNKVAMRFSDAAQRYDQFAHIQKKAAGQFDIWLSDLALPSPQIIAEIGCGTGFFTHLLHQRYPDTLLHVTDFAPGMVAYCRAGFAPSALLDFQVCDGRSAHFTHNPDWIVSTMCFQWFDPLTPVLAHHFRHCRVLAFSVLLDGSFSDWQAAHARSGLLSGLQPLPGYAMLRDMCAKLGAGHMYTHRISLQEWHPDGFSFANSLRAIGADEPRANHHPVNLRSVFRELKSGLVSNYEIGFFCLLKDGYL